MTMTAGEAMQALLDGEIVYSRLYGEIQKFKLSDNRMLLSWRDNPGRWEPTPWLLNSIEGVYSEYPLTFKEALIAMLDGKIVKNDLHPHLRQRFHDGCFEHSGDDGKWQDSFFSYGEQKTTLWKVVE